MHRTSIRAIVASFSVATLLSTSLRAQPPDNTKVNRRDRSASQLTAGQQSNNRSDVSITRDIRRAIVKDKSLSTNAHNIKVITKHGDVTLKGPVRTEDEKKAVEAKAIEIAGADHVKSQVAVTDKSMKRRTKQKS
jgi:hyperosmotically inducible protein